MNPEFWLENWKQNKIGFHQKITNPYLPAFWQHLETSVNSQVFVPLCGKSIDLLWLRQQGHNVLGVEVSELAANQFFFENEVEHHVSEQDGFICYQAESLTFMQGDFFQLTADHLQDIQGVFDRAALVALPFELRQKYVKHLTNILPNKAKILLIAFEYDQSQMNGPPFSVNEAEIQLLYQARYEIKRLLAQEVLDKYPQFRDLGLSGLEEKVYLLQPYQSNEG
jgi:thiopurine S-methyltransferase